jgi:hypothetical protein
VYEISGTEHVWWCPGRFLVIGSCLSLDPLSWLGLELECGAFVSCSRACESEDSGCVFHERGNVKNMECICARSLSSSLMSQSLQWARFEFDECLPAG